MQFPLQILTDYEERKMRSIWLSICPLNWFWAQTDVTIKIQNQPWINFVCIIKKKTAKFKVKICGNLQSISADENEFLLLKNIPISGRFLFYSTSHFSYLFDRNVTILFMHLIVAYILIFHLFVCITKIELLFNAINFIMKLYCFNVINAENMEHPFGFNGTASM